jgi:hypothetical protein
MCGVCLFQARCFVMRSLICAFVNCRAQLLAQHDKAVAAENEEKYDYFEDLETGTRHDPDGGASAAAAASADEPAEDAVCRRGLHFYFCRQCWMLLHFFFLSFVSFSF